MKTGLAKAGKATKEAEADRDAALASRIEAEKGRRGVEETLLMANEVRDNIALESAPLSPAKAWRNPFFATSKTYPKLFPWQIICPQNVGVLVEALKAGRGEGYGAVSAGTSRDYVGAASSTLFFSVLVDCSVVLVLVLVYWLLYCCSCCCSCVFVSLCWKVVRNAWLLLPLP